MLTEFLDVDEVLTVVPSASSVVDSELDSDVTLFFSKTTLPLGSIFLKASVKCLSPSAVRFVATSESRRFFAAARSALSGSLEDSLEAIPASWSEDRGSDEVSTVLLAVFEAETPGVTFVVVALSEVDPAVTVGLDGVTTESKMAWLTQSRQPSPHLKAQLSDASGRRACPLGVVNDCRHP